MKVSNKDQIRRTAKSQNGSWRSQKNQAQGLMNNYGSHCVAAESPESSTTIMPNWHQLTQQGHWDQLAVFLSQLPIDRWPDHSDLNLLLTQQTSLSLDEPLKLRLTTPPKLGKRRRQSLKKKGQLIYQEMLRSSRYESMIMEQGLIPHRLENIHDLMNAAIWSLYPNSKLELHRQAYLIQQQMDKAESSLANGRNQDLDRLTCFDEGGLILICAPEYIPEVKDLLGERDVALKSLCLARLPCQLLIFGHGIWEDLYKGKPAVHAMTLALGIDDFSLGAKDNGRRLIQVDQALAAELRQNFQLEQSPRVLASSVTGSLPLTSNPIFPMEKTGQSRQASSLMKP